MEEKNLQEVMELINRIAEGEYDPPELEDVAEVNRLTGQDWTAEDLRLICCEYWSHNSLEETAYQLIHGDLPVVRETDLAFWRAKSGAALDAAAVYRKYCTGGAMKALEPLPMEEILTAVRALPGWKEYERAEDEKDRRFDCESQSEYWSDTHFWLFPYGKDETVQMVRLSCHNMSDEQMQILIDLMAQFDCSEQYREEEEIDEEEEPFE